MNIAWVLLCALALMWGANFALIEKTLPFFDPYQIMAMRLLIGAVVLLMVALTAKRVRPLPAAWWQYLACGFTGNVVPFSLIAWGQLQVSSSVSGAIMGTMPLMTAALATVIGLDQLSLRRWAGLALGVVGLWVLMLSQDELGGSLIGTLAIVGAVVSYAVTTNIAPLGPDKDSLRTGFCTMVCSAFMGAVVMLLVSEVPSQAPAEGWFWLAIMGLFPTGIAAVFYFKVIQLRGPVFLSQVNYMVPVVALTLGIMAMGEPFHWSLPTATALILLGLSFARQRVE